MMISFTDKANMVKLLRVEVNFAYILPSQTVEYGDKSLTGFPIKSVFDAVNILKSTHQNIWQNRLV